MSNHLTYTFPFSIGPLVSINSFIRSEHPDFIIFAFNSVSLIFMCQFGYLFSW